MYDSSVAHGIMFHHFTDARHPPGQGAITSDQFYDILTYVGTSRILTPSEWIEATVAGKLEPHSLCLTFDDALLCQFEIAKPVLDDLGLKAFWFVYSAVFKGDDDRLEIYRHYRTVRFADVHEFYISFFETLISTPHRERFRQASEEFMGKDYLKEFPFYTYEDRLFRYVRDIVLGPSDYFGVMDFMIEQDKHYDRKAEAEGLWMNDLNIVDLKNSEHEIGLHSYSHPTAIGKLRLDEQRAEYELNALHLRETLGENAKTVSHPCGSYSNETLDLLAAMGVKIGFRSNMVPIGGRLCLPRQDHSNIAIELGMR